MSTKRAWSASLVFHEDTLFVTGGMTTWGFPLDSTEIIKYGKNFSVPGPKMPLPLAGHVHVEVSQTDSLIIGKNLIFLMQSIFKVCFSFLI